MLDRAYTVLEVKAIDDKARTISGIASTPAPDRSGDILEPAGATFRNPLPLLLHHDKQRPIGQATLTRTADGIAFTATLPTIAEPGPLRDRVNEAWQSVKAGIIRGASIGFRPLDNGVKLLKGAGRFHFLKTEILELSLVTIPANVDATILTVKAIDAPHLAALGRHLPGVSGRLWESTMITKTTAEHISALEASRQAKAARMADLMQKAADAGTTLDAAGTDEYDGLAAEVKAIDADLVRLRELERLNVQAAAPIVARPGARPVSVKSAVAPGTVFTRYAMALVQARGDHYRALEVAKQWHDTTPEVETLIKAAVAPGTTTDPAWAGALAQVANATGEFIELLRPATIIGKIPNLRKVPFLTSVPIQTGGGSYNWVGQGAPKPVTKITLGSTSILMAKAAGIIVLTEELVRSSDPSAELVVRNEMIKGITQFLDQQFIDPTVAAVTGVSPASITNGTTPITSAGDPVKDVKALISAMAAGGFPLSGLVLIMSEVNAFALGFARNAQGVKLFPDVNVTGGSVEGIRVVASNAAGTNMIVASPEYILYADDGGVAIDVSREASVQMDSAPDNPAAATTVLTSLWQNNLVGLRAERYINWNRVALAAVKYVSGAVYPASAEAPAA